MDLVSCIQGEFMMENSGLERMPLSLPTLPSRILIVISLFAAFLYTRCVVQTFCEVMFHEALCR